MARVLGLDLGSYSVKATLLETSLRGSATRSVVEVKCPSEGDRLAKLRTALGELLSKGPLYADTIVAALPGTSVATHPVNMPFADPKKIEAALAFEVESQLPYDLTDAVFDYQIASQDEKGARLTVGVVKKDEMGPVLDLLKSVKLEPHIVTHPGLAYQNLLSVLSQPSVPDEANAGAVAVVDIGHERVSVAIGKASGPIELARTFSGGGLQLTKALAAEFKITLDEAQKWKEAHGALGEHAVGEDAERASACFIRGLEPLRRELRPTFKSYTARSRRPIERVILCGGTAKLQGLAEQLERDLQVPVANLELPMEVREACGQTGLAAAQSYALALRGAMSGRGPRFNLRKGEFAFKSDFDSMLQRLPQLATFAGVLLSLLISSGIVRNTVLERRDKQVDQMVCDITQKVLGKCEKNVDKAVAMLKGTESPAAVIPRHSAVNLLAELTTHMPTDGSVTFDQVVVDLDRISMRCETTNSKLMEDLIAQLKTYKCFSDVKEGKIEKSKDGSKVGFRLEIEVQCPDEGGAS